MRNFSKGQKGTIVKNMCNNLWNNTEMIWLNKKRKKKMTKSIQQNQQLKREAYKWSKYADKVIQVITNSPCER